MESSHTMSVTIDGITFGTEGNPKREFVTTVTQRRHPRGWLIALWTTLGIACLGGAVYLVMAGHLMGVALLPVAVLTNYLRGNEIKDRRRYVVTGLAARHGEVAVILVPRARPFMGIYVDRAWVFPAGSISCASYGDGFVRVAQSEGALDVGMRHGKKIVQSKTDKEDIEIRIEGADAESDGQAVADLLYPKEIAPESVPEGNDGGSEP